MSALRDLLEAHVARGSVPGAVSLTARGDRVEVEVAGSADIERAIPMARDSIFRIASITKPITAAAVMVLVDDGRLALDDAVDAWLPELASPVVVRTPASPVDDVVPATRPISVRDLLTGRTGYGFASDFALVSRSPSSSASACSSRSAWSTPASRCPRPRGTGSPATTGRIRPEASSWPTARTGSGATCRRFPPEPADWPRPWTTGFASPA
ncbi:MAG TPA: serine hydrolase domain-containing protein [Pengzhenrongella sp.]